MGRRRVEYPDPRLAPILGDTYGVMVYQEQVMQIAQEIGGYTLGAADLLRRAMGKKKPEEMAKHRDVFAAGAQANGLMRAKAMQLFDLMEKFAGYGFNKSHAAAYALVAYQTAYFKAHHPAAFMAANLSLVSFSRLHGNLEGQVTAFFVMVVAAAEVVIGLAIIMTIFRSRRSASIDDASLLKW